MVDIHCHILYGVDDGSDDLAETVEMLRLAERGGTVKVIATPHSNVPGSTPVRRYSRPPRLPDCSVRAS